MATMLIAENSAVVVIHGKDGKVAKRKIRAGKLYRSDDPLVQGRENMFTTVEDTSASPGAKRSVTTRSRKPKTEKSEPAATSVAAEPTNESATE